MKPILYAFELLLLLLISLNIIFSFHLDAFIIAQVYYLSIPFYIVFILPIHIQTLVSPNEINGSGSPVAELSPLTRVIAL